MEDRYRLSLWNQRNAKVSLRQPISSESGQIIVEYVLLLVVAIAIAALITKAMISSDPGNPGFVFSTWSKVNQAIGADTADDIAP